MVDLWSSSKQYVEAGKLKVIAVVSNEKLADAPQYPLISATYPVFDFSVNNALVVAAQTPKPIIERLTREVHAIVAMPAVQARMRGLGMEPITSTPEEYNALAQRELSKWTELARANKISMQ
jgi:tripartite-type tricarboxylate transporter receptor subunit TctC